MFCVNSLTLLSPNSRLAGPPTHLTGFVVPGEPSGLDGGELSAVVFEFSQSRTQDR